MKVDRVKALRRDYVTGAQYFCSARCLDVFEHSFETRSADAMLAGPA